MFLPAPIKSAADRRLARTAKELAADAIDAEWEGKLKQHFIQGKFAELVSAEAAADKSWQDALP